MHVLWDRKGGHTKDYYDNANTEIPMLKYRDVHRISRESMQDLSINSFFKVLD